MKNKNLTNMMKNSFGERVMNISSKPNRTVTKFQLEQCTIGTVR